MNAKPLPDCGLIPSSSPPSIAPPTMMHDPLVGAPAPTPSSLASLFLHPSLAASLAGYPPHPWAISWMNAAASYGFANAASSAAAMDLTTTVAAVHHRNPLSSIADLRLKAKRHAEELVDVSSSGNHNNNNNNESDEQPNSPL